MAAAESPLDEPFLVPGEDEEQRGSGGADDVANMEAQLLLHQDTGASFWRSCLNLSNVISGTITTVRPSMIF
jgi:vesicular inhibitory amino acid transporter